MENIKKKVNTGDLFMDISQFYEMPQMFTG